MPYEPFLLGMAVVFNTLKHYETNIRLHKRHHVQLICSLTSKRLEAFISQRCPSYQLHFPPKSWKWGPQHPKSGWAGKLLEIKLEMKKTWALAEIIFLINSSRVQIQN